jgi:exopolysaccharide biosynthesis polyprenyl glycosylphosphotransferase
VWRNDVDMLILAPPADYREGLADLIDRFACLNIEIHIANDLPELDGYVERRAMPPTRRILGAPISGLGALGKRLFDVVGASVLLILTMPVLIVAALAIAIETPGGVFFRQDRIGYRDARFRIWKFRSMHLAASSIDAGGCVRQATRGDARVTRVGALLRRSSIDELPQLINVLCGDMSLVGPRPHAPRTLAAGVPFEDVVDCYSARHRVRPGLTGLAQVRGLRGQTDTEAQVRARVASDFEYIRAWSLWLDIRILFRTVGVVMKMHNAH